MTMMQNAPGKPAEAARGVQGPRTPPKSPRRLSDSRRATARPSRRLLAMAQAIASAAVGAPVAWTYLPKSTRALWMRAALAALEADRIGG